MEKPQDALDTPSSPPYPTAHSFVDASALAPAHRTKGKEIRQLHLLSDYICFLNKSVRVGVSVCHLVSAAASPLRRTF